MLMKDKHFYSSTKVLREYEIWLYYKSLTKVLQNYEMLKYQKLYKSITRRQEVLYIFYRKLKYDCKLKILLLND